MLNYSNDQKRYEIERVHDDERLVGMRLLHRHQTAAR
jgi:hypothetical protein